jgi:hypothetical protein
MLFLVRTGELARTCVFAGWLVVHSRSVPGHHGKHTYHWYTNESCDFVTVRMYYVRTIILMTKSIQVQGDQSCFEKYKVARRQSERMQGNSHPQSNYYPQNSASTARSTRGSPPQCPRPGATAP